MSGTALVRLFPIIAGAMLLLLAGCVTRPSPHWGWRVTSEDGLASLVYGRLDGAETSFAVICDIEARVADLVYHVRSAEAFVPGARTELLIAVDEIVDTLPAEIGPAEIGAASNGAGPTVIARTVIPPAPVAQWVGKQLVVGAMGYATMLIVPPQERTITAFLNACRPGRVSPGEGRPA